MNQEYPNNYPHNPATPGYNQQPPYFPPGYPGYGQAPQVHQPYAYPPQGFPPQPEQAYFTGFPQFALWIQRFAALFLDLIVNWAINFLFAILLGVVAFTDTTSTESDTLSARTMLIILANYLVLMGYIFFNWVYLQGKTGSTWGKKVMGIAVVDQHTLQPIGMGKSFLRQLCHFIDALPLCIGFLMPLWDDKKQTFADKIMGTVVIKNRY